MKTDRLKIIFLLCSLWLVFPCFCLAAKGKDFVVVIDPGHGGHDPGAIGRRGKEKNINLNVALKVGQLIQNNCNDVKVIYTRKTDVFIPLDRRAQIANNAKADLFISIHTNSIARGRTVRGAETYTLGLHRTEENLEVAKKENSAPFTELISTQFFFPTQNVRILLSDAELSIGTSPFSRKTFRYASWFTLYFSPWAVFPFGRQLLSSSRSFTHVKYSSTSGLIEVFLSFSLSSPESSFSIPSSL